MDNFAQQVGYFNLQLFAEEDTSDVVADSVAPQDDAGGNADVSDDTDFDGDNAGEEDAGAEIVDQSSTGGQKKGKDLDSVFAQMRREKEAHAKEAAKLKSELAARDAWVKDNFGASHGFSTWEQYSAAVNQQRRQQQMEDAKKYEDELRDTLGIEPSVLRNVLKSDPEFQALKHENEQARQERYYRYIGDQFEELKKEFPDIKKPEDVDQDTWAKFNRGASGIGLLDAYIAVHRKELLAKARSAGEKEAVSKIGSKSHLGTEKSGGGTLEPDIDVAPEKLSVWRALGYKDLKDIKKRERKFLKSSGR